MRKCLMKKHLNDIRELFVMLTYASIMQNVKTVTLAFRS